LPDFFKVFGQLVDVTGTVQQRIVCVQMEVGELSGHGLSLLLQAEESGGGKEGRNQEDDRAFGAAVASAGGWVRSALDRNDV
jgi:hypothetical protein